VKVLHHRDRIERAGGTAVFVVHDSPARVRAGLLAGLDLPWPVLVDLDRVAYRAWGLRRASFRTVWLDPRVWARYGLLLLGGQRLRRLGSDTLQLGGDFVVDADGVVTWARPQQADDRPPVGVLLAELERAARH
jgi:AhpC/TSA antioxidant enzyme